MTTLTDTQVITASGGLVELGYSQITGDVNVVSTTAGSGTPVISALTVVCDGGPILVEFFAPGVVAPSTAGGQIFISLYQDGSEKSRYWSNTSNPAAATQYAPAQLQYRTTPSAGSHTFDVRAFVSSTTGTPRISAGTATTGSAPAFLRVSKIVQATQWPAVTTGTIICTSSTRPASPFEGQQIWETDTDKFLVYNGSAWYPPWNQPWGPVAYAKRTSAFSTASTHTTYQDITGASVSVAWVAGRRYRVTYAGHIYTPGGTNRAKFKILRGSTMVHEYYFPSLAINSNEGFDTNFVAIVEPSSSATETVKVQLAAATNNTQVSDYADNSGRESFLMIEDIGPV